jgi:hypothetical protein
LPLVKGNRAELQEVIGTAKGGGRGCALTLP